MPAPVKKDAKLATIEGWLTAAKPKLRAVLPRHIDEEKVIRLAMVAASTSPKLRDCTPISILLSVMEASQLGLMPHGSLGHGWMIPYGKEARFIPGYRGLMDLATRGGHVTHVEAEVVFSCDHFKVARGTHPELIHEPELERPPDAEPIAAYAVAWLKGGGSVFKVLSRTAINKVRDASRAGNSGPWVDWPEAMWQKTAIKNLCKFLPMQSELAEALALDANAEQGAGRIIDAIDVEVLDRGAEGKDQAEELEREMEAADENKPQQATI